MLKLQFIIMECGVGTKNYSV